MSGIGIGVGVGLSLDSAVSLANQYYVSSVHPDASDSNAGTSPALPWSTFAKIKSEWAGLPDGSTVHLDQGSEWTWTGDNTVYWTISSGGSAGSPITIRGDDYDSGTASGKPKLRHTGAAVVGGAVIKITGSYVTLRDFTIDNDFGGFNGVRIDASAAALSNVNVLNMTIEEIGDYDTYACGIWLNAATNDVDDCLIQGNDISDHVMVGLNVYSQSGGQVNNCTFRDNRVYSHNAVLATSGPPGAVQTVRGGSGNVWEYNYFEDSVSGQVWLSNASNTGATLNEDVTIRFNIFRGGATTGGDGFVVGVGSGSNGTYDVDFYGNYVYDCKENGIQINGSPDVVSGTLKFYNNTLYANYPALGGYNTPQFRIVSGDADIEIKNNLFFDTPGSGNGASLEIASGFTATITHNNNLFWSSLGATGGALRDRRPTDTSYLVSAVTTWEATAENTNPLLVDTATPPTAVTQAAGATPNGLEVQFGSDAVDNGADLGAAYAEDINGVTRTTYDIGATEYVP